MKLSVLLLLFHEQGFYSVLVLADLDIIAIELQTWRILDKGMGRSKSRLHRRPKRLLHIVKRHAAVQERAPRSSHRELLRRTRSLHLPHQILLLNSYEAVADASILLRFFSFFVEDVGFRVFFLLAEFLLVIILVVKALEEWRVYFGPRICWGSVLQYLFQIILVDH